MAAQLPIRPPDFESMDESELVRRAQGGERNAFRAIMRRGNQRLFRTARAVMRDDAEAEDVVQEAYVRAFANLASFRGECSIFTWLTRITLNEANGRLRRRKENVGLEHLEKAQGAHVIMFPGIDTPEADVGRAEARRLIEAAVDELPEHFRVVFIMRDVQDCSVAETAECLGLREETVKTRLHRARRLLRGALSERLVASMGDAFPFLGARCDRITEAVLARLEI